METQNGQGKISKRAGAARSMKIPDGDGGKKMVFKTNEKTSREECHQRQGIILFCKDSIRTKGSNRAGGERAKRGKVGGRQIKMLPNTGKKSPPSGRAPEKWKNKKKD